MGEYKLTYKQEKFSQNILLGMTQTDAYKDAYDAENMKDESIYCNASKLTSDAKVAQRIEELQEMQIERLSYTVDAHLKELEEIKLMSLCPSGDKGIVNHSTAGKMVELKGKVLGHYTEKISMDANISGVVNVNIRTSKDA